MENIGVVFDECNFHEVFNASDIEKYYLAYISHGTVPFTDNI